MASDFDKDALEVERNYSRNRITKWVNRRFHYDDIRHRTSYGYRLAEWLVGFANVLRSASDRDGYEWVDRRTSLFSKYAGEQQAELIAESLVEQDNHRANDKPSES